MEFLGQPYVPAISTTCKESTAITVLDAFPQPGQMPNMCFSHPMPIMQSTQQLQQMPGMHSSEWLQHPTSSASQKEFDASSTIGLFIPNVEDDITPRVDMLVDGIEEAYNLYNTYAKAAGFSVRKSSDTRRNNEVIWKKFVCSKEGCKVEKPGLDYAIQRRVTDTRENCGAELQVKKNAHGQWFVCKFIMGHTHILSSPRKAHMLRSHRVVSAPKKNLIDSFSAANIRTCSQMDIFEVQAGGRPDLVGFTQKDVRNYDRDKRKKLLGKDGQRLYEHFKHLKESQRSLLFSIESDSDGHVKHVFWTDHIHRASYTEFGDVVSFDTTYKTNKFDLVFGVFTGVNHHGQTTTFGYGLISDETFETFVWLFKNWIEAMPGDPPKSILTDQDPAMKKAIRFVFPNTCHRFCLWHIMGKLPVKLGGLAIHNQGLVKRIKKIVYNSDSKEEFESRWEKMLRKFKVHDNKWLNELFEIRGMWIPVFMRGVFFGGMRSTQRSESINAFVKQLRTQKNGLYDFVLRLEGGIARLGMKELKADHESLNGKPILKTEWPMEKQMAEIYTRKKFYQFQVQFMAMATCIVQLVRDEPNERIYDVSTFEKGKEIVKRTIFKKDTNHVNCSCQMFEFEGIPCSHILCILKQERIFTLLEQYILRRWSIQARKGSECYMRLFERTVSFDDSLVARHGDLLYYATMAVDESSMCSKAYQNAKKILLDLIRTSRAINEIEGTVDKKGEKSCKKERDKTCNKEGDKSCDSKQYLEPKHIITKGRAKRLKSSKEKALKNARLCRGCNKRGVSHDKRNCPALVNRGTVQESALSPASFDEGEASINSDSDDESDA